MVVNVVTDTLGAAQNIIDKNIKTFKIDCIGLHVYWKWSLKHYIHAYQGCNGLVHVFRKERTFAF